MKNIKLSKRYAKALYNYAQKMHAENSVFEDCKTLHSFFKYYSLRNVFESPVVTLSKKRNIFIKITHERISDITLYLFLLIIKKKRGDIIPEIINQFDLYYKNEKNILDVDLVSAVPLKKSLLNHISQKIKLQTGASEIELHEQISPQIIGGIILRFNDVQIDLSVRKKLASIKERLTQSTVYQ